MDELSILKARVTVLEQVVKTLGESLLDLLMFLLEVTDEEVEQSTPMAG